MKSRTPRALAEEWASSTEHVLGLIHSGQLRAFSISPPGSKRPRFRIPDDAVAEYERLHSNGPQPAAQPQRRKRPQRGKHKFYV